MHRYSQQKAQWFIKTPHTIKMPERCVGPCPLIHNPTSRKLSYYSNTDSPHTKVKAHAHTQAHFYRGINRLCVHVGNSISLTRSPDSPPADITPPPAPRPSPLVQEDELLSNNLVPEHSNIVSALHFIAHVILTVCRKRSFRFLSSFV